MLSSSNLSLSHLNFHTSPSSIISNSVSNSKRIVRATLRQRPTSVLPPFSILRQRPSWVLPPSSISLIPYRVLEVAFPLAASISILLWSGPAKAGILSGFSGLESIPGPQLPQIDFLNKWNEENQKKYAEFDSRFKSTTVLKDLLEKSKLNKERNRREIQDKYCLRGAEWGVGDCSTQGMTQEERDDFISMLKKKVGEE